MAKKRKIRSKRRVKKVRIETKIKKKAHVKRKPPVFTRRQRELYNNLLDDYVAKQNALGYPTVRGSARYNQDFKNVIKDLNKAKQLKKKGRKEEADKLIIMALKKTTR